MINLGFFTERLPIWLLPIAALLAVQQPLLALLLFFLAYAWHGLGAGIIAPAWSDMLARCFPIDRRGWFFGLTAFIGTGIGTAGAVLSAWLLEAFPFPLNFSYTFLIAAVAITVSWGFLALTREPVQGVPESVRQQADQSWGKLGTIIGKDINFRTFLIARLLANLGRMGTGFITVAAIEQWNVSNSMVALFTASMLIGQTAGNLLAGLVADRRGHKVTLELGQWAMAIAFALAWLAPAPEWYYPVFFFMGAGTGIGIVSGVLIVLEFSRPEHRPSYIGLGNTTSGIGSAIAPIIGGFLAVISYRWLFLVSALVSLLALAVMWFNMREPRTHPQFVVGDDPTL
ncbi:MAG: MFS transporter [Caldilineaceae bacterium]|nr:MFS transporter [Caldilineaceae bacterium]